MDIPTILSMVFNLEVLLAITIGAIIGTVVGAMPGVGPVTAQAILLPLTFKLDPVVAVAFQGAIWASGVYGGSWTAILVNVPGTSMSVATSLDGYPMARQGRALEALGAATMGSFVGGMAGVLILITLAPVIVDYVVMFGPPEFVWVNVLALVIIAVCMRNDLWKGVLAGLLGLSLSLVGLDEVIGIPRYTFGTLYLQSGIDFIPVMVGLFGFAEIISMASQTGTIAEAGKLLGNLWSGFAAVFKHLMATVVGTIIGVIVGIIPGIGGSAANLLAYSEVQRRSKSPETFGQGNVEGVIAAETSNNAIQGAALIPTLTLGIPGSASSAILLMALIIHGFTPGRMLFNNGNFIGAFFITLIIAQFTMVIVGLALMKPLTFITLIPNEILAVVVSAFCFIGVYSVNAQLADVLVAVIFGYVGYALKKNGFPLVGLVVGLILGGPTERAFAQTLAISGGNYGIFFTRPLSLILFAFIILLLFLQTRHKFGGKGKGAAQKA